MISLATEEIPMNNLAAELKRLGLRALPAGFDDFLAHATQGRWSRTSCSNNSCS